MSTRTLYRWCKVQKKVVPAHEVAREVHANVAHGYIPDEMPPTRSPATGKYYTSKAALRAEYKSLGYEEIGTAYDHGYDPGERLKSEDRAFQRRLAETFRGRLNGSGR